MRRSARYTNDQTPSTSNGTTAWDGAPQPCYHTSAEPKELTSGTPRAACGRSRLTPGTERSPRAGTADASAGRVRWRRRPLRVCTPRCGRPCAPRSVVCSAGDERRRLVFEFAEVDVGFAGQAAWPPDPAADIEVERGDQHRAAHEGVQQH